MQNQIKKLRKKANLTMKELADTIGITENYVYMIESGTRTPSFKLSKKFSDFFGLTVDEIFFTPQPNEMLDNNKKVG